ncbi:helicase associated domain-containing protein (plasmid) [Coraliomargarita sp. W4R53]
MHTPQHLPNSSKRDLTQWWMRYHRVERIATQLGRLPRLSDGADPADVGWAANQRRATSLTPEQFAALAALPGWSNRPRADAWEARAEELRNFIAAHGRMPRVRGEVEGESALAHWFSRQRLVDRAGELGHERSTALRYATRDAQ